MKKSNEKADDIPEVEFLMALILQCIWRFLIHKGRLYAVFNDAENRQVLEIPSAGLNEYCRKLYYQERNLTLPAESIRRVTDTLKALGGDKAEEAPVSGRIAQIGSKLYYNLKNQQAVFVTPRGKSIKRHKDIRAYFVDNPNQLPQVIPDMAYSAGELPALLAPFLRVSDDQMILLCSYIVSCFWERINHPMLLIYGEHGTSKSTFLRCLKKIIDPTRAELSHFPKRQQDVLVLLENNYFIAFDNMTRLSNDASDLFCMAVTGGTETKRALYTDGQPYTIDLQRCIAVNGISAVATRSDLISRSILIEMSPIKKNERKTEAEYNQELNDALPAILGAILDALYCVLNMEKKKVPKPTSRMADFEVLGYKIAEAIQSGGGKIFLQQFWRNQKKAQGELALPMIVACLDAFLEKSPDWSGTISKLLREMRPIAEKSGYALEYPKAANALSRQLNGHKNELSKIGIEWKQAKGGDRKIAFHRKIE